MLLYHGTTEAVARAALTEGLLNRKSSGALSRWKDNPSHASAVYLTTAYALYFSIHALEIKDGCRVAVVEVDADLLNEDRLAPDEDCLEQINRDRDAVAGDMDARTKWYRRRIGTKFRHQWRGSLTVMGTCAYLGNVPPRAITRISLIDPKAHPHRIMEAMDPTITPMNYLLCGERYRELTQWAFVPQQGITVVSSTHSTR